MSFYSGLASTADRLVTKYGRVVTFSRYTPTVSGPAGTVTKGTATATSTARAMKLPVSTGKGPAFDNRREDLSLARKELAYLQVAATSITIEPRSNDEVSMDSATWLVLGCTPINPAGTALTYGVGLVKL